MARPTKHRTSEWHSAAKAARLSGLSRAMVDYLCRTGIVEPTCDCERGHGNARHYSFGDVVALRLVKRLSLSGVSILRLKGAMTRLRTVHPQIQLTSLPASHVVTDGTDLYLCEPGQQIESLLNGQYAFAFVVELSNIQREVAEAVRKSARTGNRNAEPPSKLSLADSASAAKSRRARA